MTDQALISLVRERANNTCEYCQLPRGLSSISFEVDHITRPRTGADPDISVVSAEPPQQGGSVGIDCLDCTFPCGSSKTACERDCFRGGLSSFERGICDRTCEQMYRGCLRGCPGCD